MKRLKSIILARCSECDRPVYDSEGAISEHLLDVLGICRDCAENIMAKDFTEIQNLYEVCNV
jgi:hypothetical protein